MISCRIPILLVSFVAVLPAVASPVEAQETERSHSSEHFEITWEGDPSSPDAPDLADDDRDGVPDTVERVLDTFERARAFLVDELGYRPPPNEGLYPLFVAAGTGFGYTQPLFLEGTSSQPSYILVPLRFLRLSTDQGQLDIFAVHEFHHAVQLGYDAGEDHWLLEATSTWLEDVWRDDLDRNHLLLRAFVPRPELPLTYVGSDHQYGAFLFLQFLSERFDGGGTILIRQIWEQAALGAVDSVDAIGTALAARGVRFADAWGEFLLWRYRLSHFSEGDAYRRALADIPWPAAERVDPVDEDSCRRSLEPLPRLTSRYIKIKPAKDSPSYGLGRLTVSGPPGSAAMAEIKLRDLPPAERVLTFDETGVARLDVSFGRRQARRIVLGVSKTARARPGATPVRPLGWSMRLSGYESTAMSEISGPDRVSFFNGASLSGQVTCAGVPQAGAEVVVTETDAAGQQKEYAAVTGTDGTWFLQATPQATSTYVARVSDPLLGEASTIEKRVEVALEVGLVIPDPRVPLGEPIRLEGRTFPAHGGVPVEIEFRRPERPWRKGPTAITGPDGDFTAELSLPRAGVWELRAKAEPGDGDHLGNTSVVRRALVQRA